MPNSEVRVHPAVPAPLGGADPVLIADDDRATRERLGEALQQAGIGSVSALNSAETLEMAVAGDVSLVVMDAAMRGRSGLEVLAELRADEATAELPVILTGSGRDKTLVRAFEAGAVDFISQPVRTDELVARVRSQLHGTESLNRRLRDEIQQRAQLVDVLARIDPSGDAGETAELIVDALVTKLRPGFIAILQLAGESSLVPLAAYAVATGIETDGPPLNAAVTKHLLDLAERGPWVEVVSKSFFSERDRSAFGTSRPHSVAGAPIYAMDRLVGMLTIGSTEVLGAIARARLMAAAIDFATVLSLTAGTALDDGQRLSEQQTRLNLVLATEAYSIVFQPIVRLSTQETIGYEALTRFTDGADPGARFAEIARAGLTGAFEIRLIETAMRSASVLPERALLTLNVAPETVLSGALHALMEPITRRLVLEITEHASIADYGRLRESIAQLGDNVAIAVDDAGAGYASLRHILELRPEYVKLDATLVRGINLDAPRQAMVAGLVHFAQMTGCKLIAEGVETEDEATSLRKLGIDLAQGFLFGRPTANATMSAADFSR